MFAVLLETNLSYFAIAGCGEQLKYDYLMILYQVVDESTVCLMGHERRQTLALITDLRQAAGLENSLKIACLRFVSFHTGPGVYLSVRKPYLPLLSSEIILFPPPVRW